MKFSALLPTRNRLEYLKFAVDTVRRQDYDDWEIVISDNASDENIGQWVDTLQDGRVKYSRSDQFVPVTDNWNRSLVHSSGDWVIMLGDDDGLMPGYFSRAAALISPGPRRQLVFGPQPTLKTACAPGGCKTRAGTTKTATWNSSPSFMLTRQSCVSL